MSEFLIDPLRLGDLFDDSDGYNQFWLYIEVRVISKKLGDSPITPRTKKKTKPQKKQAQDKSCILYLRIWLSYCHDTFKKTLWEETLKSVKIINC